MMAPMAASLAIAILATWLLVSCGSGGKSIDPTDITLNGFEVEIPQSIYINGLYLSDRTVTDREEIKYIVLNWIDLRIDEWAQGHPERTPQELQMAKAYRYKLIDHWGFPCGAESGLCAGQTWLDSKVIVAAIYALWRGERYPEHNAAPHTVMTAREVVDWTGNPAWEGSSWYAGDVYADGGLLKVIGHELDHVIGIDHQIAGIEILSHDNL